MSGKKDDSQKTAADSAAQQNQQNAQTNFQNQQNVYHNMFGTNGQGGAVGSMMDPAKLNVTSPQGPDLLQYNSAVANTSNQFRNARGQLSRYLANRGFGANSPSGFGASQAGNLARDEADAQGQNFTQYTDQSYNHALNNFWNAANIAAGQSATLGNQAEQGTANAGQVYANLYANSYQPSIWQSIIPAVGQVGAAVAGNPNFMKG